MAKAAIKAMDVTRVHPLAGQSFGGPNVSIAPAPEAYRCSLRADARAVPSLSKALGIKLPRSAKQSITAADRSALWLGPDEWLIIDTHGDPLDDLSKVGALHSAVDVSHRNTALLVNGPRAADVINAGCPQDLSLAAFPVGACSRTILGKIEVVLLRTDVDAFRLEVWRSFSAYAFELLSTAASHN